MRQPLCGLLGPRSRGPGPLGVPGRSAVLLGAILAMGSVACIDESAVDSGVAVAPDPYDVTVQWEERGVRVKWTGGDRFRFGMAEHGEAPGRWTGEDCAVGGTLGSGVQTTACHEIQGEALLRYGADPRAVVPGLSTAFHPSDAGGPPGARTIEEYARGTSYLLEVGGRCYRWNAGAEAYSPWDGCEAW